MKIIEVITKRKDALLGCWYGEQYRDTCIIITNGTGGGILNSKDIDKYILISPTDTEERTDGARISSDKIQEIANEYKKQNQLDEIIPILYDEYNYYTARSFIDAMENENHHNLPIYNDKKGFGQLQSINIKGLFVMGQKDGFAKQNTQRHLETINQYSKNKDNIIRVIENTGHTFRNKEVELSKIIINFVKQ